MARRYASHFPQRINMRVPSMSYVADIEVDSTVAVVFGAPLALDTNAILAAQVVTTAGSTTTLSVEYLATEAQMGRWGRNLTIVNSAANTAVITIRGRDYLGQRIREDFTSNGATPVQGLKAFRYVDSIAWAVASAGTPTLDVGIGNKLGLPFKFKAQFSEVKNETIAANAGTFVSGLLNATPSTATTADVRGTYLPVTVIPDGTNVFEVRMVVDIVNLHGNAQFYS